MEKLYLEGQVLKPSYSIKRNRGFCDEHRELEVERKNFKSEPIHGFCG
jgi:hypothetical protein